MTDFVYDGSLDGFLCAAALALAAPGSRVIPRGSQPADLFCETVDVPTDQEEAARLRRRVGSVAGSDEVDTLLLVHSSADPRRHALLLSYLGLTLRAGHSVAAQVARPDVHAVRRIRDRVSLEMERFLGFTRLRRIAGRLYCARIRPDADIVGMIGPHFAERFPDQALLVIDDGRAVAFWADGGRRGIVDTSTFPRELAERLSRDCDPGVEELWRAYFERIANPERRNARLQKKLMPARYWGSLVEHPAGRAG